MNMNNTLSSFMDKLAALCDATNATILFESKFPPSKYIKTGESPFMRFLICNEHGKVLVCKETKDDMVAACELTLLSYQNYVLENHIAINIPVNLGRDTK